MTDSKRIFNDGDFEPIYNVKKFSHYYAKMHELPIGEAGRSGELVGFVLERLANTFIKWADTLTINDGAELK